MKFSGTVIHGEGRGRELGFPTVNLEVQELDLAPGVYAVKVGEHLGAMNWGPQPTFGGRYFRLEIFLIDFKGELYGDELEVQVGPRLRDTQKFETKEALIQQIEKYVLRVRGQEF